MFKLQANMSLRSLWSSPEPPVRFKTDSEVPKARAERRRLPEAEHLNRAPRGINRDETYARGDARTRPARRLLAHTSLPKFTGRLVPDGIRRCDYVIAAREPAGAAFVAAGKFRTAALHKNGQPCATIKGQP